MSYTIVTINGTDIDVNEILCALRPKGYVTYYYVRDRKTGELYIMAEPKINPVYFEVVDYSEVQGHSGIVTLEEP